MTNIDPLSEAREALREVADNTSDVIAKHVARLALARLDALPAPERVRLDAQFTPSGWGAASAWAYFDAPMTDERVLDPGYPYIGDAAIKPDGTVSYPVTRDDGGEP